MGSCHFHPCYRGEMLIEQVLFHASSVYRLKVSTFKSLSKHFWYISIVLSAILSSCYSDNSLYTILYSFVSWERNLVNWWIPHFPTIRQNSSAQTNHYDYFYNFINKISISQTALQRSIIIDCSFRCRIVLTNFVRCLTNPFQVLSSIDSISFWYIYLKLI